MKKMMINLQTKKLFPYDFHTLYQDKGINFVECTVGYIVSNKDGRAVFMDKSKKGFFYIGYNPDRSDDGHRIYRIFNNNGDLLLKEYHTYCGYDRGPKMDRLISDMMEKYQK